MTPFDSASAQAILDFWFPPPGAPGHDEFRGAWFAKDADFDAAIRQRFGALLAAALDGGLPPPRGDAEHLAQILLLDQFSRNLHRGGAQAFAGDPAALALAAALVGSGRDKNFGKLARIFIYLPFEHSEDPLDQERSVALFAALRREAQTPVFDTVYDFALRHRDIILRFGRFPHRNAALGRQSSTEESGFLSQPGSSF